VKDRRSKYDVVEIANTILPLSKSGGRNKRDRRCDQGGNGVKYLAARIARDRPDILNRMKAGEFRSIHQAAIEAGITKAK